MKYVIVGNSAAGISAAETIRELDQDSEVCIISDEEIPFYSKCLTSYYIAGDIDAEDMILRSEEFYDSLDIEGRLGNKVIRVNPEGKEVILDTEEKISFDKLLIATGGSPVNPKIEGIDNQGVFTLRTYEDAIEIAERAEGATKAVVVGGGFVGMKTATALSKQGLDVEVVELENKLLGYMIDETANEIIKEKLKENGIEVFNGQSVTRINGSNEVESVVLDNGEKIDCDMAVVSVGVESNTDLVAGTDIEVNRGIIVDNKMLSNHDDIYAAGDVAEVYDIVKQERTVNALWPLAIKQGKIAGANMVGDDCEYAGSMSMNSIDFFDLFVISVGMIDAGDNSEVLTKQKGDSWYRKFILKDNILKGAIFVNQVEKAGIARSLIENEVNLRNHKENLLNGDFSFYKNLDKKQ
jgi:NAD(P)H-nitrite reductase large subunit